MPEPTPTRPSTSARQTIGLLTHGHRVKVALVAATSLLGGLAEAIFLVLATRAAFAITNGKDSMGALANRTIAVSTALLLMLALVVLRMVLAVATNWYSASLTAEVTAELRQRLARAFLRSRWAVQQLSPSGRLQELVTGFANSGSVLISAFVGGLIAACSVGAMLALAVGVDPLGSLAAVGATIGLGSLLRPVRRRVHAEARRASADNMGIATSTNEISELGMAVQVFGVRDQVERHISAVLDSSRRSNIRLNVLRGLVPAVYSGLAYLALVGAVAVASATSTASLSSLGAVMLIMLRSLSYGQQLQGTYTSVNSSLPATGEVFEEIFRYESEAFIEAGSSVQSVCPIRLDGVSFHYVDGQPVLHDVTAEIRQGEMIGIVGPSGSGKSTLVQLLLGLRDPVRGAVLADGHDIRGLKHSDWSRRVTFVPQTPMLITGTVADNIRFFRDSVTDADIERAARLAGLHDEIVAFPDAYQHQVGARGGNLSGGQQQRLCIARALAGAPDVLILDEPTSSLDARSEAIIRETFSSLRSAMTMVVIAHRLSTIDECDRIMVIQDGRVTAFDSPAVLRESENFYAEAVRLSGLV